MTTPDFDASPLWNPYEAAAVSWKSLQQKIDSLSEAFPTRIFAWRGIGHAAYPLNSSLYRRLWWTRRFHKKAAPPPREDELQEAEDAVIAEAMSWGLHSGARGRLSALELLATLQHYGAPTRLIDISFSPLVGAFFSLGSERDAGDDGRLFAVDVTDRLIEPGNDWEHAQRVPWKVPGVPDWTSAVRAWRPAAFDRRIAAQQGGFLLGGVPNRSADRKGWPKNPAHPGSWWTQDEMRAALPIAARAHKFERKAGAKPTGGQALFSIRIASAAKAEIAHVLKTRYSLDHSTLFGDFSGLAEYGVKALRRAPP